LLAVVEFLSDVRVLADCEEADAIAQQVVEEELARARAAILDRLAKAGLEASVL
jgi:hypothetical protein